eukprot:NODE_5022_length_609_cov_99.844643_g4332_i0.p1 GENE.NODE_5022_length_609_cov_99.844643_g4332_i0~~NODE_5022_length_609_cov_99.844643_g4332_i0.p1  ORF type:complete len:110 (+),score=23.06 NODE_5022_length_609_cov_99.844643_g4332_i0:201-530(+)
MLDTIQRRTHELAESLAHVTGSLRATLHANGRMTAEHMGVYQSAVGAYAGGVDEAVGSMSAFIERCTRLGEELRKMRELHKEIKSVVAAVDALDTTTARMMRERRSKKR